MASVSKALRPNHNVTAATIAELDSLSAVETMTHILMIAAHLLPELSVPARRHRVIAFGPPEIADHLDPRLCDDFVGQPWTEPEIRFRVRRLRRHDRKAFGGGELRLQPAWLECRATHGSLVRESITDREHQVVSLMARSPGAVISREVLLGLSRSGMESKALDMQISRLRKKLHRLTAQWPTMLTIQAVRGQGYRLVERPWQPVDKP